MPKPNENLVKLHTNLTNQWQGFSVPFDQFEKDMQDETKVKRLHENLSKNWKGFAVPYEQFKTDMGYGVDPVEVDNTDGVLDNFGKGVKAGWQQLKSGVTETAANLAPALGLMSANPRTLAQSIDYYTGNKENELGQKVTGLKKSADEMRAAAPQGEGFAYSLGTFIPQAIGIVAATASAPFTGGTSLSAVPAIVGSANIAMLVGSSMGSAMNTYEEYMKESGQETNEAALWGVGIASGAAEYFAEKLGTFNRFIPKGAIPKAVSKMFSQGGQEAAQGMFKQFAKSDEFLNLVKKYGWNAIKHAGEEGFEEVATELGNIAIEYGYKGVEDGPGSEEIKDRLLQSFEGGAMMGGMISPVSTWSKSAVAKKARQQNGFVTLLQDEKGNAYEAIQKTKQNGRSGYIAINEKGNETFVPEIDIDVVSKFSLKDFDKFTKMAKQGKAVGKELEASAALQFEYDNIDKDVLNRMYRGDETFPSLVNGVEEKDPDVVITAKTQDGTQYQIISGSVNSPDAANPMVGINIQTGEKRMLSDRDVSQVDILPANKMRADLRMEAETRVKGKYQLESIVSDIADKYQPGDQATFNGQQVEIVDVTDPSQGVTVKIVDAKGGEQVVTLTPDQLSALQPVGGVKTSTGEITPAKTWTVGKKQFTYTEQEDGTLFVPFKDGKDETKAIAAEVDDAQFDVVPVVEEVPIPNAPPFAKKKTQTVVKGVNIVPKQTNGTETQAAVSEPTQSVAAEAKAEEPQGVEGTVQPSAEPVGEVRAGTADAVLENPPVVEQTTADGQGETPAVSLNENEPTNEQDLQGQPTNPEVTPEQVQETPASPTPASPVVNEQAAGVNGGIAQAEAQVNPTPTEGQKEAGNYQKGHVTVQGFDITIENPKGSTRSGTDKSGKAWSVEMKNTYGYFKRTTGKDGDQIDTFIGDNPLSEKVFVVDQLNDKREFDESKVMIGFNTAKEAQAAYMSNYSPGWKGFSSITETSLSDFKEWLYDGARQGKPFADYKDTPLPTPLTAGQKLEQMLAEKPKEAKPKKAKQLSKEQQQVRMMDFFKPRELAMQWFASGGKLNSSSLFGLFGTKDKENDPIVKARVGSERRPRFTWVSKEGKTIDQIAHELWEDNAYLNFDSQDYYEAVERVVLDYNSTQQMAKDLLQSYEEAQQQAPEGANIDETFEQYERRIEDEAFEIYVNNLGALPSQNEIDLLFLPYELTEDGKQENDPSGVQRLDEQDNGGADAENGTIPAESEGNASETDEAKGRRKQIADLESQISRTKARLSLATSEYNRLNKAYIKSKPNKQAGIDDKFIAGSDVIDFGDGAELAKQVQDAERRVKAITAELKTLEDKLAALNVVSEQPVKPKFAGEKLEQILAEDKKKEDPPAETPEIDKPTPPTPPKPKDWGKSNKVFTEDAAAKARAALKAKFGNLNVGIDPETMMNGITLAGFHIEAGARKFADYARAMIEDAGNGIKPYLKSFYEGIRNWPGFNQQGLDSQEFVSTFDIENFNTQDDVLDRPGSGQPDSPISPDEVPADESPVPNDGGESGQVGNGTKKGSNKTGGRRGGKSGSGLFTSLFGEPSDNEVYQQDEEPGIENNDAGDFDGRGSHNDGAGGYINDNPGAEEESDPEDQRVSESFKERTRQRIIQQKKVDNVPVQLMDEANIRETLPVLLPEQQDDVLKAERRFFGEQHKTKELANGKGMLFTNGTGTGKTFTGLGIIKRFAKQGKTNILIVVPSEAKVNDWIKDAEALGLKVTVLKNTKDQGKGINITTYATFRANENLKNRDLDLVVYDESHRIMEEKRGTASATTFTHYQMANTSVRSALDRITSVHPVWVEVNGLREAIRRESRLMNNLDMMDWDYAQRREKLDEWEKRVDKLVKEQARLLPSLTERAEKAFENTKVVFLSATPFKGHFNLRYAKGSLINWDEETVVNAKGSRVDGESRFFLENFGSAYEWKFHRLQVKEAANAEAIAMQEVEFAEKLMRQGVMSGRAIESEKDYSREFPLVALENSEVINRAYNDIYNRETDEFSMLRGATGEVFSDYQYKTRLFESLKASMLLPRIEKHLALGRKIVVFHRRKQANVEPPFALILRTTKINATGVLNSENATEKEKAEAALALQQVDAFEDKYSDLLAYEQTLNYSSAIDQIVERFGSNRVAQINGDISKKDKPANIEKFNDDNSGVDIIIVQEEAGKEGISLHDTSGKHQRVLMSLSLPISSTTALQIEGRIFRIGQETDAIFENPLLGLDMEVAAFGQTVNKKLSTTENLAIGNQARDLLRSFAEGVLFNSSQDDPNTNQGKGGKEYDKKAQETLSEFRKAVLVYNTNQKTTGKRDQREGVDYFATPEPVGQKMVEWLDISEGESVLEPSAGHGAIAMWFPEKSAATVVEPSYSLFSKLSARAGGGTRKLINDIFENLNLVNKFHGIAMNPPFGSGGKTAMDHVEKAFNHLKNGGRLVALIPNGGSMDKRLEQFLYGTDENGKQLNPDAQLVASIKLPSVTFKQAGTSVSSRIVVIDRVETKTLTQFVNEVTKEQNHKLVLGGRNAQILNADAIKVEAQIRYNAQQAKIADPDNIDLAYIDKIDDLFDAIEDIDLPNRNIHSGAEVMPQASPAAVKDDGVRLDVKYQLVTVKHTKTGEDLFIVRMPNKVSNDEYRDISNKAKAAGGFWDKFSKGFRFPSVEDRQKFVDNAFAFKDDNEVRFRTVSPSGFYSTVESALETIKQDKGTPEQFKAMLLKNGAKQAEMDWMGWDDTFTSQKSITKSDVKQWIDGNRIEVKEVVKGKIRPKENKYSLNNIVEVKNHKYAPGRVVIFDDMIEDDSGYSEPSKHFVYVSFEEAKTPEEAKVIALEHANDYEDKVVDNTKFSQYTEPGGSNYKELLLTMPVNVKLPKTENLIFRFDDETGDDIAVNSNGDVLYRSNESESYRDFKKRVQEESGKKLQHIKVDKFVASHYDEPNILAHVRFNERTGENGERVLFVEEFQSDWAQKGKKEGFKTKSESELFAELESKGIYRDKKSSLDTSFIDKDGNQIYHPNSSVPQKATPEQDAALDLFFKGLQSGEIPQMPFSKTDQWVNLAFRRMMKYAAENGFDRIAWTNGTMQAERYDLSKQVDNIQTFNSSEFKKARNEDYHKDILIYLKGQDKAVGFSINKEGRVIEGKEDYYGKNLDEIIGKDIATQIINSDTDLVIDQAGLKVGGSGMKAFYDAIIPSAASKLGKPFGAKVENIDISYQSELDYANPKEDLTEKFTVQSLPVTESMRKSAMEGLPLFRQQETEDDTPLTPFIKRADELRQRSDRAKELGQQFGVPVKVITNRNQLPERILRRMAAGRLYPGVFDGRTGQIYVLVGEVTDMSEVEKTVAHEIVAHKGLREMLGRDEFDSMIADVYKDMDDMDINFIRDQYTTKDHKPTNAEIADEYIASLAETGNFPSWFGRVIAKVRSMLRRNGFTVRFSDADIMYLLWESQRRLLKNAGTAGYVQYKDKEMDVMENVRFSVSDKTIDNSDFLRTLAADETEKANTGGIQEAKGNIPESKGRNKGNSGGTNKLQSNEVTYPQAEAVENKISESSLYYKRNGQSNTELQPIEEWDREQLPRYAEKLNSIVSKRFNNNQYISIEEAADLSFIYFELSKYKYQNINKYALLKALKILYDFGRVELNELTKSDIRDMGLNVEESTPEIIPSTITVNGTPRPTTNSKGQPIHPTIEGVEAFWRWFGESKVVDAEGRPLVVYHGTDKNFNEFDPKKISWEIRLTQQGPGFNFTNNIREASGYGSPMGVYLAIDNPIVLEWGSQNISKNQIKELLIKGNDKFFFNDDLAFRTGTKGQNLSVDEMLDIYIKKDLISDKDVLQNIKRAYINDNYSELLSNIMNVTGNDGVTQKINGSTTVWVALNPTQIKSATGNDGSFDPDNGDIRFKISSTNKPTLDPIMVEGKRDKFRENVQDKMLAPKNLQEQVTKRGGLVPQSADGYNAENRSQSRSMAMITNFNNTELDQLNTTLAEIVFKHEQDLKAVNTYLLAKSSLQRNNEEGTKALNDDVNGAWGQVEVEQIIADFEAAVPQAVVDQLWKDLKATTDFAIKTLYMGNVIGKDAYNAMKDRKYYVPLKSWDFSDTDNPTDFYNYVQGEATAYQGLHKAHGRGSKAADPLAYIESAAHSAVVSANKNMVKHKFLMLARLNPNMKDLFNIKKIYLMEKGEDADGNPIYVNVIKDGEDAFSINGFQSNGDPILVNEGVFEELYQDGKIVSKVSRQHMTRRPSYLAKQHEVEVMENGERYIIAFGDPNVANSINNINTALPETTRRMKQSYYGRFMRWVTAGFTAKNPAFIPINWLRDLGYSSMSHLIRKDGDLKGFISNYPAGVKAIHRYLAGTANPGSDKFDQLYEQFRLFGGETGFVHLKEIKDLTKDISREVNRKGGKRDGWDKVSQNRAYKAAGGLLDYMAIISENSARFATFLASVEGGKSFEQAASDAKNISVNFNRKGRITGLAGTFYGFFNASVQGADNFLEMSIKNKKNMAIAATSFFAVGLLLSEMLKAISPDDEEGKNEYEQLPEWVRKSNLCIPDFINGGFITIPLPFVFREIYGAGVTLSDVAHGDKPAGEGLFDTFAGMFSAFSPIAVNANELRAGKPPLRTIIPTLLTPIYDNVINQDFTGRQVYKVPFTKELERYTPNSELGAYNANSTIKAIAQGLNKLGGGNEYTPAGMQPNSKGDVKPSLVKRSIFDWNPSKFEHLLEYYLGGRGRFVNDIYKTAEAAISSDREVQSYNIPVMKRLYTKPYKGDYWNEYMEIRQEVKDFNHYLKKAEDNRDFETMQEMLSNTRMRIVSDMFKDRDAVVQEYSDLIQVLQDPKEKKLARDMREQAIKSFVEITYKIEETTKQPD